MNPTEKINKRFIAAAICPKCGLMDKTIVYTIGGQHFTECVSCGFKKHTMNEKKEASKKVIWLNKENKE